ncbi:MAG: SDR family NAD(P)-dependent oxidoreductase [bacterium]|nr:SDR family NAD(P)-dependent oxidoreductase [bacterium]
MIDRKVMLITGTSRSIGKYLAEYYSRQGFAVIGCSRKEVEQACPNYRHFVLDVTDEAKVKQMFITIAREYGRLDILINNAGLQTINYVLLTTINTVNDVLRVNVAGPFLFCREAAKLMKKNKEGRIINFSSIAVPLASPGSAVYSASKAALEQFSRVLAKEVYNEGIKVNVLSLSIVQDSGMAGNFNEQIIKETLARTITKKPITYQDISQAIDSLVTGKDKEFSGQVICLGGVSKE